MKKPSIDLLLPYETTQRQSVLVGNLLVVLMMISVGLAVVQLGTRIVPTWRGTYLVIVCFFIALESIFTRKRLEELEGNQRIAFHASEWVAFAVLVKILIYFVNGAGHLLEDLQAWQQDFLQTFFTPDFIIALGVCALVWFSSRAYSAELEELYNGDQNSQWDELGKVQNMLHKVRDRLSARTLWLGGLVVTLAVFSRINDTNVVRLLGKAPPGYIGPVINVLFYFLLALVLLSLTQFALMQTRWRWQRLPISPRIARNWILFGLIAFAILSVIVAFLPTDYSISLFDTLRYVFGFLMQAIMLLVALFTLPLTFCLSLFNATTKQPEATQPPAQPIPPAIPTSSATPFPWLEFLRSLFFWIVFIGIIFFAIRYYLQQNTALWNAIIHFPLFRWVGSVLQGFWNWIRGANRQVGAMVRGGIKRLRQRRVSMPVEAIRKVFNLSRMSPREKIIHFYLSVVELGGECGIERRPAQTPYQYETRLANTVPEIDPDLHHLTEEFLEARYSPHSVEEQEAQKANSFWERIRAILRNWKREG